MVEHNAAAHIVVPSLAKPADERPSAKSIIDGMDEDSATAFRSMAHEVRAVMAANKEFQISLQIAKRALFAQIAGDYECLTECPSKDDCICRKQCDNLMHKAAEALGYNVQMPQ